MDIGLALPTFDFSVPGEVPLRWDSIAATAVQAESLGFDSVWMADHLFLSIEKYGGGPGHWGSVDPLVALGGVARRTTRVRLGTLVLCAQLRPPTLLAKALATLDRLSSGRLVAGLGAGWFPPEYEAAGVDFAPLAIRLEQLEETIEVVRGMWEGGPFTFSGAHTSAAAAMCLPRPVQDQVPVILGGRGDRLLDLVARRADGWNIVWRLTAEEYRERSAALDAACERAGRDPATVRRSVGLYALAGEDERDLQRRFERLQRVSPPGVADATTLAEWRRGLLVGTVDEVRDQVAMWADLGVDELIVGPGALSFAVSDPADVDLLAAACSLGAR